MDHILPTPTPVALNSTYSWGEDVSQALATITVDLLVYIAHYKYSMGKTFEVHMVGIENDLLRETFALAASFNNECLWLVNYSL